MLDIETVILQGTEANGEKLALERFKPFTFPLLSQNFYNRPKRGVIFFFFLPLTKLALHRF